ncbi:hypothetical protein ACQEXU_22010 [Vibrio sp. TRT 21S02]|uniref:hypothetical protein n=1 Tax=Vibrio TaxID=662 RepID=UPI001B836D7A|nr:hypothetical protein [Vibrio parahaemolyticus]EHR5321038.1 hypothetical protein [Vibrio parahaemolyticus]MCC3802427.1 hypothetical protein [Vibrio parahaemolyticus]MCR9844499.1 hypothetical protein [Vibrio parahaemolyticus]HBC3468561.1 hypothetical protein [Vibrio parahaemolyticus]HBC3968637.1 hypothetical protein [Vibrio parahaemolyticus]
MFNIFRERKEKKAIHDAFKELAAISGYLVISSVEKHTDSLDMDSPVINLMEQALGFSEDQNHRVAYIHFMEAVGELDKLGLIDERDPDVAQGISRIRDLKVNVIDKLFKKYY